MQDAIRSDVLIASSALQDKSSSEAAEASHRARAGPGVGVACPMSERCLRPWALLPQPVRPSPTAPSARCPRRPPSAHPDHAALKTCMAADMLPAPADARCARCASRESRIHGSTDRGVQNVPKRPGAEEERAWPSVLLRLVSHISSCRMPLSRVSTWVPATSNLASLSLRRKHDSILARLLRPWVPFGF